MVIRALILVVGLALSTVSADAQTRTGEGHADNPYIGTWMEDTQRTTYGPGQKPPLLNIHRWEPWDGNGMKASILTVDAGGMQRRSMYFLKFDGNWYPVIDEDRRHAIRSRRIDAFTFENQSRRDGKGGDGPAGRHVFSKDGQTMTLVDANGRAGRVYKKLF